MGPGSKTAPSSWQLFGVYVLYVIGGVAGLSVASVEPSVTLVWPPTGIAIAAVLALGRRAAWAVLAGAFTVNLVVGGAVVAALCIALGNTAEALAARGLLHRARVGLGFDNRRDVGWFAVLAALLPPAVAAAVGATSLVLTGGVAWPQWGHTAGVWWAGDALGALVVGPLVLTWLNPAPRSARRALLASAGTALCTGVALGVARGNVQLVFVLVAGVSMVWAGLFGGARGSASACFILCGACVTASVAGSGPFFDPGSGVAVTDLWAFMASAGVVSLMVMAIVGERAASERALSDSEARFREAFEGMPLGMLIVGRSGAVLAANEAIATLLRSTREDLLNRSAMEWVVDEDHQAVRAEVRRALRQGASEDALFVRVRDARGTEHECELRIGTLKSTNHTEGLLVHVQDVGARLRAEREREALAAQLVHSQRMESIGQLAGGIAHDFNNLLQGITGNVELAQLLSGQPDRQQGALQRATEAGQRAGKLANQLLTFSRRGAVRREPTDLLALTARSAEWLERLLPENVQLRVRTEPRPTVVLGDSGQLEQVVMNLCLNARDAMPEGGTIDIDVGRDPSDAHWVLLQVSDTGPGLEPELRERVFEPFFTTKAHAQGTGLGLSVVYGIVQGHDGEVAVEPVTHGHGARFIVRLPVMDDAPLADGEASAATAPATQPLRILVAEDDPRVREVVVELLEHEGHDVTAVADGDRAVQAHVQAEVLFDVVILDVVMPRMGGREALEIILSRQPGLPAILASGYSNNQLSDEFLNRSGACFIRKPYSRAALLTALKRVRGEPSPVAQNPTNLSSRRSEKNKPS